MANFFDSQYALYRFVVGPDAKNRAHTEQFVESAVDKLTRAVKAATGEDFQQDVKDSCVSIAGHDTYDFAFDETNILFNFLQEKIGIQ
jgi:glucokinase